MPLVMGVLNVTPDSFSDGGRFPGVDAAVGHARRMIQAGADVVDVGGESTRPGSAAVTEAEEMARVMPVLEALFDGGDPGVPVSIDTRKPAVAAAALARGCSIVNDIGGVEDPEMVEVLVDAGDDVPVVVMHKSGEPRTMQVAPRYDDVVAEVTRYLSRRVEVLEEAGIAGQRIILDPGIGFGKRYRDNLELLKHIDAVGALGYPVLVGGSRKRFLGELLDAGPDRRLPGSLAVAAHCRVAGVDIVRVHDVAETRGLFTTLDAIDNPLDYFRTDEE
jgi:dihydropteroate synthase